MSHNIFYVNDKTKNQEQVKSPKLKQVANTSGNSLAGYRKSWKKSLLFTRVSIILVILIFAALIFLLNEQSKVLQMTADNAAIQYQIRVLTRENAEKREALSKNLDLDKIREEALRLGLQAPHDSQIIEVKANQHDEIIVALAEANAISNVGDTEEEADGVIANIEGFFSANE